MDKTNVTIALLWHQMNSDNPRVGAFTLANIDLLRDARHASARSPRVLVMVWRDPRPG